jgi:alpha-N-acetylglucosaminidase
MVDQITAVEPNGVWLPQGGWMFHYPWWRAYNKGARIKQYLTNVPASGVLILELSADKGPTAYDIDDSDNYWGRPWIWTLLHNYGQRPGMYGDLDMIASQPMQAIQAKNSTCVGIGISPEGIEQNPVVYELVRVRGSKCNN